MHIESKTVREQKTYLNLPTLHGFRQMEVSKIIRCEASSNYTQVFLEGNTKVTVSKTLHKFEEMLTGQGFFRIHYKHLINTEHFREYIRGKGGQAILSDGTIVDVSVRRKKDFLEYLKSKK